MHSLPKFHPLYFEQLRLKYELYKENKEFCFKSLKPSNSSILWEKKKLLLISIGFLSITHALWHQLLGIKRGSTAVGQ